MKYYARIGGNEYEIEIGDQGILLDGIPVAVDIVQSGTPELYSVLFGGHSFEMFIQADRFNYTVNLRSEQFQVQIEDERGGGSTAAASCRCCQRGNWRSRRLSPAWW